MLVVANKVRATPALIEAARARAGTGPAEFVLLVANPAHHAFDRNSSDLREGGVLLAETLPGLEDAVGSQMEGRVATSPNVYDDIVQELNDGGYSEIILETPPSHLSHRLHVDLVDRITRLGYPLTTVIATH